MSPIKSGEKTAKEKPPGIPSQVHRQLKQDLARLVKKFNITNDLKQEKKDQKYIQRFLGKRVDLGDLYKHLVARKDDANLAGTTTEVITGKFWTFFLRRVYGEFPEVKHDELFPLNGLPVKGKEQNTQRKLNEDFFTPEYELQKFEKAVKQCFETPEETFPGWLQEADWGTLIKETQPVGDSDEEEPAENAATPGPAGNREEQPPLGNLNSDVVGDPNSEEGPEATSRAHPAHAAQAQGQGGSSPQTPRVDATMCQTCGSPVQAQAPRPRLTDNVEPLSPDLILEVMEKYGLKMEAGANKCAEELSKLVLSLSAEGKKSLRFGGSGDNNDDTETAATLERTVSTSSTYKGLSDIESL
jgi:hypothetical protein